MGKYLKDGMIKVLCESNDLWEAYDFMAQGEERAVDMQAKPESTDGHGWTA